MNPFSRHNPALLLRSIRCTVYSYGLTACCLGGCTNHPPVFNGIKSVNRPYVAERALTATFASSSDTLVGEPSNHLMNPIDTETVRDPLEDLTAPRDPRVTPSEYRDITLEEVLAYAISHCNVLRDLGGTLVSNSGAIATAWDSSIAASNPLFGVQGSLSEFDSRWSAQLQSSKNDRVFNNITVGGGANELTQDVVSSRASISRKTWTGTLWEFGNSVSYDANNRAGNLFPNTWERQIDASVRKPLLRGAGKQFNAIAGPNARPGFNFNNGYWIALLNTQVSQADFAMRLESYLSEVEESYWQLQLAYRQHELAIKNLEMAERVYSIVRAKYDAGLEGGEADREAEARSVMLRFKHQCNLAVGGGRGNRGIYPAERALRQLVGMPLADLVLLRPNTISPSAPVLHDWLAACEHAKESRPELKKQRTAIAQEELRLIASRNFVLPQADVFTRYRVRGFGDDWAGNGNRFASASQDLASFDHQEWDFGLEMDAPVGRRQAKAGVQSSRLRLARARAILAEQERSIEFNLADAMAKSTTAHESILLAGQIQDAANQRMEAVHAQFAIDRIPLDRVREAQEAFYIASEQYEIAKIDYASSLRDVNRQSGNYLSELGILMPGSTEF